MKTIDDLRVMDKVFLTAADIAGVVKMDPQTLRVAARQRPDLLGCPVVITNTRVRFPRLKFLEFIGSGPKQPESEEVQD